MKKSRVIVPAMAVIAFSTAASIAGSVAWFTASRTVTISGGTYSVVKTTTNLDATLSAGIGTEVDSLDATKINFTGKLTDSSFNHDLSVLSFFVPNGAGDDIDHAVTLADAEADAPYDYEHTMVRATIPQTAPAEDIVVYTAATFKITFEMNFGSGAPDVALYLDCSNATSKSRFTTDGTAKTAKGFRMALVPTAKSNADGVSRVFAGLQTEYEDPTDTTSTRQIKYVAGTDNFAGSNYAGDLIDSTYHDALPASGEALADVEDRVDYLGVFHNNASLKSSLTITVVAWFEGTDPEIVNRDLASEYQAVKSTLIFEAVDLHA